MMPISFKGIPEKTLTQMEKIEKMPNGVRKELNRGTLDMDLKNLEKQFEIELEKNKILSRSIHISEEHKSIHKDIILEIERELKMISEYRQNHPLNLSCESALYEKNKGE